MTYSPPVKQLSEGVEPVVRRVGMFVAVCSAVGLGLSAYWTVGASVLGAVVGMLIFLKLRHDTRANPGPGVFHCKRCHLYFFED